MSSVIVLAPLIIGGWPVITAAVTAAIGTMGFSIATAGASDRSQLARPIAPRSKWKTARSWQPPRARNNRWSSSATVSARRFSRDARGALKVCMEGGAFPRPN